MGELAPLTGALVELGLIRRDDLDEVLARQLIFGGDLELSLLESGCVDEAGLLRGVARLTGVPSADPGPLPVDVPLSRIVRERAPELVVGRLEETTFVYSRQPLSPEQLAELEELMPKAPEPRVTTGLRLEEALAALDEETLPDRLEHLIDRSGTRLVLPGRSTRPSQAPRPSHPSRHPTEATPAEPGDTQSGPPDLATLWGAEAALKPPRMARTAGPLEPTRMESVELRSAPPVEETAPPPADYDTVRRSVVPPAQATAPSSSQRPPEPSGRTVAYSRQNAESDLLSSRDRDHIVQVLLDYCSQFFDYTAVFAVQSAEARGLSSRGRGAPPERLLDLRVPLDLPSAFGRVRDTGVHRVARLRASGVEGGIVRDLDRPAGRAVLLIPVVVRGRTLLLIWGDDGEEDVDIERSAAALVLAPAAARAIEKVLVDRKRASRARESTAGAGEVTGSRPGDERVSWSQPPRSAPPTGEADDPVPAKIASAAIAPPPEGEAPAPPKAETGAEAAGAAGGAERPKPLTPQPQASRGEAQRTQLGMSLPPAKGSAQRREGTRAGMSIPPAGMLRETPSRPPPIDDGDASEDAVSPDRRRPERPDQDSAQPHEIAPAARRSLSAATAGAGASGAREPSDRPGSSAPPAEFSSDHPRTIKGFPTDLRIAPLLTPASSVPPSPSPRIAAPLLSRRIVPLAERSAPPPESPSVPQRRSEPSEAAPAGDELSSAEAGGPSETEGLAEQEGGAERSSPQRSPTPVPESGRTLVSRSHLPPPPDQEPVGQEPTLHGEFKQVRVSYDELVSRWLAGDEEALQKLTDGGELAVGALIARFPGPVEETPDRNRRASESGPILRALVLLGARATPFVTVRTADEDPIVRRWAVALLGELTGRESARSIAERLLDESALVRRAALASARRVQRDELTRRALRARLEEMARDPKLSLEERAATIEALADIREQLSIPTLLTLLRDGEAAVQRASKWALSVLTRQDFADDVEAWRSFWQEHRNEPREEWLIFALLSEDGDLKQAALEELSAALGEPLTLPMDEETIRRLREMVRSGKPPR